MKHLIRRMGALALVLLMAAGIPALAEGWDPDEDFSFSDVAGIGMIMYNNVPWNFPVDMMEMDPELVLLVNKQMFLSKDHVPEDLVTLKALKLDKEGNNTSGGVRRVSSDMQLRRECAEALVKLSDAARAEGFELVRRVFSTRASWCEKADTVPAECVFGRDELPAGKTVAFTVRPADSFGNHGEPLPPVTFTTSSGNRQEKGTSS